MRQHDENLEPEMEVNPRMPDWIDRLDLSLPELQEVAATRHDTPLALRALLSALRDALPTVPPRPDRRKAPGPLPRFIAMADDACRNILVACPYYASHDFGSSIDWLTNRHPQGDKEWLWQLHRHSSWHHLAEAYRQTGDEKYAQAYVRQQLDWMSKCPFEERSPAWRTIEVGVRSIGFRGLLNTFLPSANFNPSVLSSFLANVLTHADYLAGRDFSGGNWGLIEANGLLRMAVDFPQFKDSDQWRDKALRHFESEIQRQVRTDGLQQEQCLGYHQLCTRLFAHAGHMARLSAGRTFSPQYYEKLESMFEAMIKLILPDGSHAQFGDDHSQFDLARSMLQKDQSEGAQRAAAQYIATGGKEGCPPPQTAFALPESGFYSMRSAWDPQALCLVLKCGPDGGFHSHPDNGSFELFAHGRRLMPDSGSYVYGVKEERALFSRTAAHQTLTLDQRDSAFAPRLRLWRPGPDLDLLVVENQSYPDLLHRRAVLFVRKSYFVILDEALGTAQGAVGVHFHFAPGATTCDEQAGEIRTQFDRGNVLLHALYPSHTGLESDIGNVSFRYGEREERPVYRLHTVKTADQNGLRFATLLVPFDAGEPPPIRLAQADLTDIGSSRFEVLVHAHGQTERVGYDLKESPCTEGS
jgi:heparan-sulfate lyase